MKTKRAVELILAKMLKRHNGARRSSVWRTGFDQGAIQALAWALEKAGDPCIGYELTLVHRLSQKARSTSRGNK